MNTKMDFISLILVIILFLVTIIYFFLTAHSPSKLYPPGPRGFELVRVFKGCLDGSLAFLAEKWPPLYGEIVFCPLPGGGLVFLNTPSATRELYSSKTTEKYANDRMPSYASENVCGTCVVFSSIDAIWMKMRKLLHLNLNFYGEGVAEFERHVSSILGGVMKDLDKTSGDDVSLRDVLETSFLDIIAIMLTGKSQEPEVLEAMRSFNSGMMQTLNPTFGFAVKLCPFLDRLPGTYHARTRQQVLRAKEIVMQALLYDMKATRVPGSPRGIVDRLLDYQSNEGADWMTDGHVEGLIIDIVCGSAVSSTETIHVIIFYLLHHPDVMRKVQAEVSRVVGPDRKPTFSDRRACPYTEALVLECSRLMAGMPLGGGHLVVKDLDFRGFFIPSGTMVFSTTCVFNKSPDLWTDPHRLHPDRFLDHEGQLLPANHPTRQSLLSFGTGKRCCPGENFARARIFLYVTSLLQRFDLCPPEREAMLPMTPQSWQHGMIRTLKPYKCRLVKRQE